MKKLILVLSFILSGCFAQVESTPPESSCPVVACGWEGTTCLSADNSFSSTKRFEQTSPELACWFYDTVCVPKGTRPECVPDECRREIADCQPDGAARVGGP